MAANTQPIFPAAPKFGAVTIVNSDGSNAKTVYTAGPNGSRIMKLNLVSTDTVDQLITPQVNGFQIGIVKVPAGSGTQDSSHPTKDVLSDPQIQCAYYDALGNLVIDLQAGQLLQVSSSVAVTSGKTITAFVMAADF